MSSRFVCTGHHRASGICNEKSRSIWQCRARLAHILELYECAVLQAQSADSSEDETKRNVEVGPTHPVALNEVLDRRTERG